MNRIPAPFSFERLRYICARVAELEYRVITFSEFKEEMLQEKALLLLRHDIDVSLDRALRVARLEAEFGLSATYFIRTHSEFYSPLTTSSTEIIREIVSLGHEIGYHYESKYLAGGGEAWACHMFSLDMQVLGAVAGQTVRVVSPHSPTREGTSSRLSLERGAINAFGGPFIHRMRYLSDSCRSWREGCFSEHVGSLGRYQVLIHPASWCTDATNIREALHQLGEEHAERVLQLYDKWAAYIEETLRRRR